MIQTDVTKGKCK